VVDVIELRPVSLRARATRKPDNPGDTTDGGKHSQAMMAAHAILHF